MVEAHPEQIRADIALWPTEEPFFFDKLRLYAWASDVLFSGKSVGERLLALSDGAFWETQHRRELLHLLRLRWRDLPSSKCRQLERCIANGRARYRHESQEDYHARRSSDSATMLGWLDRNGCQLGKATLDTLRRLRNANPHWRPEWDEAADESFDGGGGFVKTFSDPTRIINAPLDKIVPLAEQHTVRSLSELTSYRPFDGLVKQRPRKAVAALTHEARKGNFPIGFWSSTLQNWPDKAPARLVRLLAERLARLPTKSCNRTSGLPVPVAQGTFLKARCTRSKSSPEIFWIPSWTRSSRAVARLAMVRERRGTSHVEQSIMGLPEPLTSLSRCSSAC